MEGNGYHISSDALGVSAEVDMALAYTSEKLENIENLLLPISAGEENDIEAMDVQNDDIFVNALTFDLLYALLSSELRELDSLLSDLQDRNSHTLHKISTCEHSTKVLDGLVYKLHDSEELIKQLQDRILEVKLQLAKGKMASFCSQQHEWRTGLITEWKPEMQTMEERSTLRMLEKSLARELEQEKKLTKYRQNEDLKLKIRLIKQVAASLEEVAEAAWGRFLEADNTSQVLMGISKEMLEKLQAHHSNLSSSTNANQEITHKLHDCMNQLHARETLICSLNGRIAKLMIDNVEVTSLREKVRFLEEKLRITESRLEDTKALNEVSQKQLREMGCEMETLRENFFVTGRRAASIEEKALHLTESNIELAEALEFLKGSNDSNARKAGELEKQVRELDIQLQHARASSKAGQEQQNLLYSAIWDMETLIEELKQKVVQSESKVESTEARCTSLLQTNSEMSKEVEVLRSRMEFMERSLNKAADEKKWCAKDVSIRTSRIMDTVMQLAQERERIQNQLITVAKENKLLRESSQEERKLASFGKEPA